MTAPRLIPLNTYARMTRLEQQRAERRPLPDDTDLYDDIRIASVFPLPEAQQSVSHGMTEALDRIAADLARMPDVCLSRMQQRLTRVIIAELERRVP